MLFVYRTEELKEYFGDTSGFLHFSESNFYVDFLVVEEAVEKERIEKTVHVDMIRHEIDFRANQEEKKDVRRGLEIAKSIVEKHLLQKGVSGCRA